MGYFSWLRAIAIAGIWVGSSDLVQGVQLANGKVYFTQPPRLVSATTTFKDTYIWGATYYFTLSVPENAGEPLQRVTINQYQGEDEIEFYLKNSEAFGKIPGTKEQKLQLGSVTMDQKTHTISLVFDPPVLPGEIVRIGLYPVRNPRFDGVYLFGVTAFPAGKNPYGQFLGYGRLQFYHQRDFFLHR